jgi:hypothetical protein
MLDKDLINKALTLAGFRVETMEEKEKNKLTILLHTYRNLVKQKENGASLCDSLKHVDSNRFLLKKHAGYLEKLPKRCLCITDRMFHLI